MISVSALDELRECVHENLLYSQQRAARLGPRAVTSRVAPWLLIDADDPDGAFDAAIPTTPSGDAAGAVATALDWFGARQRRCNFFLRGDADRALAIEVSRAGYAALAEEPVLVLGDVSPSSPAPRGLVIETVDNAAALAEYARTGNDQLPDTIRVAIAETAFAMPGAELLVGRRDGRVIATSMCVLTGRVIGIFNVNVVEAWRRRGLGSAMTLAAVAAGARRGGHMAWLGSTPMSDALYRRLGFRELYRYVSYVSAAPQRAG